MSSHSPKLKSKPAFISAGMIVIIIAIAGILISSTYVLLLGQAAIVRTTNAKQIATLTAESCMEIALNQLLIADTYTAGETYNIGEYSCTVTNIEGLGNENRQITTSSTVDGISSTVSVEVSQIRPNIVIERWISE